MKHNWEIKKFDDCIESVRYTTKIPSSEYLGNGLFPIISQEDILISGWWNEPTNVFKVKRPIVVFGDHTRIIKYVDFDFVLGADGVKVLLPIENLNAKFLYYYLTWSKIPSLGYSRHFKLLKELFIPVPLLAEQQHIVTELDLLNSLINKQKAQLTELERLAESVFYDMFGDPVENEKGWEVKKLGEIGYLGRGVSKNRPRNAPELLGGDIPLIQTGDVVRAGLYITEYQATYSKLGLAQSKLWNKGTLCITIAANIGNTSILAIDACFPDSVVGFLPNKDIIGSIFIHFYFKFIQKKLEKDAPQVAQKNINLEILNNLIIPIPPLSIQQQFAATIEKIEAQKALVKQSIAQSEQLLASRMQYYFE